MELKYIKIEIKFKKPYLLCVCCVFIAFPSFRRPFWAIFCLTVDATTCHVQKRAKGRKTGIQICQPTFEVPIKMPAKNQFNPQSALSNHNTFQKGCLPYLSMWFNRQLVYLSKYSPALKTKSLFEIAAITGL